MKRKILGYYTPMYFAAIAGFNVLALIRLLTIVNLSEFGSIDADVFAFIAVIGLDICLIYDYLKNAKDKTKIRGFNVKAYNIILLMVLTLITIGISIIYIYVLFLEPNESYFFTSRIWNLFPLWLIICGMAEHWMKYFEVRNRG